ncbi:LysE family translocator [Streptomyces sp. WAC07094]|uniref:LysE family translocator n=1 Tax=Streptomyces sp. WAC07094 TaxID=3072183 RepID=UPI002EB1C27E|nr:LysE family translocator [Streptomyces sp. WAC07094]
MAVFPLIVTPGASLALLVQHVIDGGRRQALPVILGTVTGLYIHAALAIAGLSALVMHCSLAFTAVKLIGAVYLIGLGTWTWRSAALNAAPVPYRQRRPKGADSVYAQALLANVLNPKAAAI